MDAKKKRIPVREGLWTFSHSDGDTPRLIGSRCPHCGEIFFPKKEDRRCINCQKMGMEETLLSASGKIYSLTIVMQRPPVYYQGEVPYAIGYVELPEGIRLETLFTAQNVDDLSIGMDVDLVIEKLCDDENGNEITVYKFKQISSRGL
jgi:uncharacterized protein